MTKPWFTVVVAWLTATALAVAQAPTDPSLLPPAPRPTPAPTAPPSGQPAAPATPAAPGLPAGFVGALPFVAPPPPPTQPALTVTGTIDQPGLGPMAWVGFDYMYWRIKSGPNTPPLVTQGSLNAPTVPGALGDPFTQILFGGTANFQYNGFNGGQLTAGLWLDYDRDIGFEGSGFLFQKKKVNFTASSDSNGNPVLTQPFFDVINNVEAVASISIPMVQYGSIAITSSSRMGGAEANLFTPLVRTANIEFEGMVGFRYFNVSEDFEMLTNTGIIASFAGIAPLFFLGQQTVDYPQVLSIRDSFKTDNSFYGGQIGVRTRLSYERFYVKAQAEAAFGAVQEVVDISGLTQVQATPGGIVTAQSPGGIFAVANNSGHFVSTKLGVMPSGEIKGGFEVLPGVAFEVGYSALFLNHVVRPGNLVDRNINTSEVPSFATFSQPAVGPAVPVFSMNQTSFWAQGVSIGVIISY